MSRELSAEERQRKQIEAFAEAHREETVELVKTLTRIPAPSFREEKKAAFVLEWLRKAGAEDAYIDEAGNVVYEYPKAEGESGPAVLFMAHMDVVFPDLEPVCITEKDGKLYAPGICDDNADLANLLMGVKYVLQYRPELPARVIFVANVCEEGLGNLKGSRYIYEKYGAEIREFIGFDANLNHIVNLAVGSRRYRVTVHTEGGHSYTAFGNENAIYKLACIIQELYQVELPVKAKTTYNVGEITGGTSVNTIAQSASMLYEFRSEDVECLAEMEGRFTEIIERFREEGLDVEVETLGVRPCGKGVDERKQAELTARHAGIIRRFTGEEADVRTGSTDANIFLAHGIPSNVIGTGIGGQTHTREEWLEKDSLVIGQKIALASIVSSFTAP